MILQRFFEEIFVAEIYKPVRTLGHIGTVIDLGATTGEFSLWVYTQADFIYAIEGLTELYKHLKENVINFTKIKPFNLAIGDKNRSGHMTGGEDGGARLSSDETPTDKDIEVCTLATFMKKNNIDQVDCLKIDIEDGEKQVFESIDFPEIANKVKFIIGEHVAPLVGGLLKSMGFEEYENGAYYQRL